MLPLRQAILQTDRQTYALLPGRANSFEELHADFQSQGEYGGQHYSIFLHPKQDLTVRRLEVQFDLPLGPAARFFANGFQSWSESRHHHPNAEMPRLRGLARRYWGHYGDDQLADLPRGPGHLHSWTYTTVQEAGRCWLLGSLNESTGFTLFLYDWQRSILTVRKDMAGLALTHSFPALDFWVGQGQEQELLDAYFAAQKQGFNPAWSGQRQPLDIGLGWCSWYRHFNRITEPLLRQDLAGIATSGLPVQYFQVDDGWQTAVGDWLSVKSEFPGGMGRLANDVRAQGLIPGLWLAPFVASARSTLVRQHPDWLLRDQRGKPLRVGWNPLWGGWYHALNFYHPAVQEYLSGVFHIVLEKWGYGLLKLDFLFAACLAPPPGKTRGQVMHEAMEFLRRQLGDRLLLACGVPLSAAFGWADYCRIGGDIHLAWEHRLLAWLRQRERVSTLGALRSTLGRWPLGGRAFGNDPDVFILRQDQQRLTPAQQHTVLTLNALLGQLLSTSDDLGRYSPEQIEAVHEAMQLAASQVTAVQEIESDFYQIDFLRGGAAFLALSNLSAHQRWRNTTNGRTQVQPFATLILPIDVGA